MKRNIPKVITRDDNHLGILYFSRWETRGRKIKAITRAKPMGKRMWEAIRRIIRKNKPKDIEPIKASLP